MATLIKVKKASEMTPEYVRDRLFYFHDMAHTFHQQTTGGWEHDALGKLYESLVDFKDDIPEKIMGYIDGKRLGALKSFPVPEYIDKSDSVNLAKEIIAFSEELIDWAENKKFCDIENIAQSLSGLGAKTVYRLTLT